MRKLLKVVVMVFVVFTFWDVKAVGTSEPTTEQFEITTNSSVVGTVDKDSYYVTNTGTIKVTKAKIGDTFEAYKILDAFYNPISNVVTYEFTSDFKNFLPMMADYKNLTLEDYYNLTSGDIISGSTQTNSTLDKLMSGYAAWVRTGRSDNSMTSLENIDGTVSGVVDVGAYLIVPETTNYVYGVMVGNVELVADSNSKWTVQSTNIVAKVSDVGISKELSVSSIAIGKEYTNTITATVPKYPTNARNTTYVIEEVFADGITLPDIASIIIKDGTTTLTNTNGTFKNASGDTVAVISVSGQKMTITFTATNVSANVVTITYNTALNDSATLGNSNPNSSTTTLTYSDSPYTPSGTNTIEVNNDVYTYGIKFNAIHMNGSVQEKLADVVIEIYSDAALTTKVGTITTGSDGNGVLNGVATGKYYLKNVKVPAGYTLFNVFALNVGNVEVAEGYYSVVIDFQALPDLPFTGGVGTIIYTVIGLSIIIASVVVLNVYRKRKGKELS